MNMGCEYLNINEGLCEGMLFTGKYNKFPSRAYILYYKQTFSGVLLY